MWHGVVTDLTMFVDVGGLALLGGSLNQMPIVYQLVVIVWIATRCLH